MKSMMMAAFGLMIAAGTAQAHATLETAEAAAGSNYKAVVRIGHGCDGQATLKLRVQLPEGMISVKPMPKAGWTLETVSGDYAQAYDNHGTSVTNGVREVIWTGSLLDEHYDEFTLRGKIADSIAPGTMLWFPVVQECADAKQEWLDIPAEGQDAHDLKSPAPGLKVTAPGHAHH